jgi:DNA-binding winged helix-turn-helix (wHTH) protein
MTRILEIGSGELYAKESHSAQDRALRDNRADQLYEFIAAWTRLDLTQPPGPQLAQIIESVFHTRAVAIFDASLNRLDKTGQWNSGEEEAARNCYLRDASWYDPISQLSERPLRVGQISYGALLVYGVLSPLIADMLAALAAIAVERHQRYKAKNQVEAARTNEPIFPPEMPVEMNAAVYNPKLGEQNAVVHCGMIELDPVRHLVLKSGRQVHLTPKEFGILHYLMLNAGRPIPHEQLLKAVWGVQYGAEHEYWRTFVRQLRKKIEDDPANPRYLKVVASYGYMFDEYQPFPKSA